MQETIIYFYRKKQKTLRVPIFIPTLLIMDTYRQHYIFNLSCKPKNHA